MRLEATVAVVSASVRASNLALCHMHLADLRGMSVGNTRVPHPILSGSHLGSSTSSVQDEPLLTT
jgi:hypothetical protein